MSILTPGTIVDKRYRITGLLGEGGMGAVYRVEEEGLDRPAALKTILPGQAVLPEFRKRFYREAEALSKISDKNIVQIYRYGVWNDNIPYLAMELVDGATLRQVLDAKTILPLRQALETARQAASGLAAAHAAGIIHRDLKPNNIFICRDGTVKLIDFGLCRETDPGNVDQKLTQTGALVGSLHYMSPECCQGLPVDERSDIYAMGIVLYEMITGTPPFDHTNPTMLLQMHVMEKLPTLSERFPNLPCASQLDQLLNSCLAKRPQDRFATARELQEDLEVLAKELPDSVQALIKRKRSGPRSKVWIAAGLAAVPVLVSLPFALNQNLLAKACNTAIGLLPKEQRLAATSICADWLSKNGMLTAAAVLREDTNLNGLCGQQTEAEVTIHGKRYFLRQALGDQHWLHNALPDPLDRLKYQRAWVAYNRLNPKVSPLEMLDCYAWLLQQYGSKPHLIQELKLVELRKEALAYGTALKFDQMRPFDRALSLRCWAFILRTSGRVAEAKEPALEAHNILQKIGAKGGLDRYFIELELFNVLAAVGERESAAAAMERSIASLEETDDLPKSDRWEEFAHFYASEGMKEEAKAAIVESYNRMFRLYRNDLAPLDRVNKLIERCKFMYDLGYHDLASSNYSKALEAFVKAKGGYPLSSRFAETAAIDHEGKNFENEIGRYLDLCEKMGAPPDYVAERILDWLNKPEIVQIRSATDFFQTRLQHYDSPHSKAAIHLVEAVQNRLAGNDGKAIDILKHQALFKGNWELAARIRATAFAQLVEIYIHENRLDMAEQVLSRRSKEAGPTSPQLMALCASTFDTLAIAYAKQGNASAANRLTQESRAYWSTVPYPGGLFTTMGWCALAAKDYTQAVAQFKLALACIDQFGLNQFEQMFSQLNILYETHLGLGIALTHTGQNDQAKHQLQTALALAEKIGEPARIAEARMQVSVGRRDSIKTP